MIYKEIIRVPSSEKIIEHNVSCCVKCGNDDINLSEYEDQFGFISTATCKECKKEVTVQSPIPLVIKRWNSLNDIDLLIANKKSFIEETKLEITQLLKLDKERKKKTKGEANKK